MYQQETITKELHLQLSDEDLAQFELDAKETERLGHIGTHMDCYMEAPRYKEYVTDAVVVDCRNGDLVICRHHNVFGRHLVNIQRNTGQADRLC